MPGVNCACANTSETLKSATSFVLLSQKIGCFARPKRVKWSVSRDGFDFWWHVWLVLGLNCERGHFFKFFGCSNDFIMQKVYCPRLLRVYVCLSMLSACTYYRFPCFLLVSKVWYISSSIGSCFQLAGARRIVQILRHRRMKITNAAPTAVLLVQYKQQAN